MKLIGLTGTIASGKTTTAGFFRACGVPVQDADAVVHELYAGQLVPEIQAICPHAIVNGAVDRLQLRAWVQESPENLQTIENIVHPHVHAARAAFIAQAQQQGHKFCVLDVPLLFETGLYKCMDVVMVVHAHEAEIAARLQARPHFNPEHHAVLQARLWPVEKKLALAHYIIDTSLGLNFAEMSVKQFLRDLSYIL